MGCAKDGELCPAQATWVTRESSVEDDVDRGAGRRGLRSSEVLGNHLETQCSSNKKPNTHFYLICQNHFYTLLGRVKAKDKHNDSEHEEKSAVVLLLLAIRREVIYNV